MKTKGNFNKSYQNSIQILDESYTFTKINLYEPKGNFEKYYAIPTQMQYVSYKTLLRNI